MHRALHCCLLLGWVCLSHCNLLACTTKVLSMPGGPCINGTVDCVNGAGGLRAGVTYCGDTKQCLTRKYTLGSYCQRDGDCPPHSRCAIDSIGAGKCTRWKPNDSPCPAECTSSGTLVPCAGCEDSWCFHGTCTRLFARGAGDSCAVPTGGLNPDQPVAALCAHGLGCDPTFGVCADGTPTGGLCSGWVDTNCAGLACWAPTKKDPPKCIRRSTIGEACNVQGDPPTLCHWPLGCNCGGPSGNLGICRCFGLFEGDRCRWGTDVAPCPAGTYCPTGDMATCTKKVEPGGACILDHGGAECLFKDFGCTKMTSELMGVCGPVNSPAGVNAVTGCKYGLFWSEKNRNCTYDAPPCTSDADCNFWVGSTWAACDCQLQKCRPRVPPMNAQCDRAAQFYDSYIASGYKTTQSEPLIRWDLQRHMGSAICCFSKIDRYDGLSPFYNMTDCRSGAYPTDLHITMSQSVKQTNVGPGLSQKLVDFFIPRWLETPGHLEIFPKEWITVHPLSFNSLSSLFTVDVTVSIPSGYLGVAKNPNLILRGFGVRLGMKYTDDFQDNDGVSFPNLPYWMMYRMAYRIEKMGDMRHLYQTDRPTYGGQEHDLLPPPMDIEEIDKQCINPLCTYCLRGTGKLNSRCQQNTDCTNSAAHHHFGEVLCANNNCVAKSMRINGYCSSQLDCPPYSRCVFNIDGQKTCVEYTNTGQPCPTSCMGQFQCPLCEENYCYQTDPQKNGICTPLYTRGNGDSCIKQPDAPPVCALGLSCITSMPNVTVGTCQPVTVVDCKAEFDPECPARKCVQVGGIVGWRCPAARVGVGKKCDPSAMQLCLDPFMCQADGTCDIPDVDGICRYGTDEVPCKPNFYCNSQNKCQARSAVGTQCTGTSEQCFVGMYPGGCSATVGKCGPGMVNTEGGQADPSTGFYCKYPMWWNKQTKTCQTAAPKCTQHSDCYLFADRAGGQYAGCNCTGTCASRIGGNECILEIQALETVIALGGDKDDEANSVWNYEKLLWEALCCVSTKANPTQYWALNGLALVDLEFCEAHHHALDMVMSITTTALEEDVASVEQGVVQQYVSDYLRTRTSKAEGNTVVNPSWFSFFPQYWIQTVAIDISTMNGKVDFTTQVRVPARFVEMVRSANVFQRVLVEKLGGVDALGDTADNVPSDQHRWIRKAWNIVEVGGLEVMYMPPDRSCHVSDTFTLSSEGGSCSADTDCVNGEAYGHAGALNCDEFEIEPVCHKQNFSHHSFCEAETDCPPFQRCHEGYCQPWVRNRLPCPSSCRPPRFGPVPSAYECPVCESFYCYGGYCSPPFERGINDTCPPFGDDGTICALGHSCRANILTVTREFRCQAGLAYGNACNGQYDSSCPSGVCMRIPDESIGVWTCVKRGSLMDTCNADLTPKGSYCYWPLGCYNRMCMMPNSTFTDPNTGRIPCKWNSDSIPCPAGQFCAVGGLCVDLLKPGTGCTDDIQCAFGMQCKYGRCGTYDDGCKVSDYTEWANPVTGWCQGTPPNCTEDNECQYWTAGGIPNLAYCNCKTGKCAQRADTSPCDKEKGAYEGIMSIFYSGKVNAGEAISHWNLTLAKWNAYCCIANKVNGQSLSSLPGCIGEAPNDMYLEIFHTLDLKKVTFSVDDVKLALAQWLETPTDRYNHQFLPKEWVKEFEPVHDYDSHMLTTRTQVQIPKRFLGRVYEPTVIQKMFAMKMGSPDTHAVRNEAKDIPDLGYIYLQKAFGITRVSGVIVGYGPKAVAPPTTTPPTPNTLTPIPNKCTTPVPPQCGEVTRKGQLCLAGTNGRCSISADCKNSYIADHTGHVVCTGAGTCSQQNDKDSGACTKQHDCPPFTRCIKNGREGTCLPLVHNGGDCPCPTPSSGVEAFKCNLCDELWCFHGKCVSVFTRGIFDSCYPNKTNGELAPLCAPGFTCGGVYGPSVCQRSRTAVGTPCTGPEDDTCPGYQCAADGPSSYKCVNRQPIFAACDTANNNFCYWPWFCNPTTSRCEALLTENALCRVGEEEAPCPPNMYCAHTTNKCTKKVLPGAACTYNEQCLLSHDIARCHQGKCGPSFGRAGMHASIHESAYCSYGLWIGNDGLCTPNPPTCKSNTDCKFWIDKDGGYFAGCDCNSGESGTCVSRLPAAPTGCVQQVYAYEGYFGLQTAVTDEALQMWDAKRLKYEALCCLSKINPTDSRSQLANLSFCTPPAQDYYMAMDVTFELDHSLDPEDNTVAFKNIIQQWLNTPTMRYPHAHFPKDWIAVTTSYSFEKYAYLLNIVTQVRIPAAYWEIVYASSTVQKNFAIKLGSTDSFNTATDDADNDYFWVRKAWRIMDTSGIQTQNLGLLPPVNPVTPQPPYSPPTPTPPTPPQAPPTVPTPGGPSQKGGGGKGWIAAVVIVILLLFVGIGVGVFFAYKKGYINVKKLFDKNYEAVSESA